MQKEPEIGGDEPLGPLEYRSAISDHCDEIDHAQDKPY